MNFLRLSTGIVLMLAGIAGLGISMLAIYGIRQASLSASQQTASILDSTKKGVAFLKGGTTRVQNLLGQTSERINSLETTLADIAGKVKKGPKGKTPLQLLDEHLAHRLRRAQTTIATLQSTVDGLQNTLALFNSLPRFVKSEFTDDKKAVDDPEDLTKSLSDASDILDQIAKFLHDVGTDRDVTEQSLTQALAWVKQIQGKLADAEGQLGIFRQRLNDTEAQITASQTAIPTGIEWGGVYAVVMLVCFAFSQIGLVLQARMLMGKSASS